MSETVAPTQVDSAAGVEVATQAVPAQPTFLVGSDGKFIDGWQKHLPEEIRDEPTLKIYPDLASAMKGLVSTKKMVGANKVAIPSKDATQADWDAFYEAAGRPKAQNEYKWNTRDELKDSIDGKLLETVAEKFHKSGYNQKQVDAAYEVYQDMIIEGQKQLEAQKAQELANAETTLKEKWGTAYEQRLHLANRMIAENAGENQEALLGMVGNNPVVADFLANIAKKFMEHKVPIGDAITDTGMTPKEAEAAMIEKIQERGSDPQLKYSNKAKYDRLTKEINELAALAAA
jgi:hypothetical protein